VSTWSSQSLRDFESEIAEYFNSGKIRAPIHLYDGNEDSIIEIFQNIHNSDWVFCSWRSHYQCLLKGVPEDELKSAILDGKSISLCFPQYKIYSSAIVGGQLPIAVGTALAIKRSGQENRVWCFLGDMTAETGIAQTCMQYASNHNLPITFVVEDNDISVLTNTREVWGKSKLRFEDSKYTNVVSYKYKSKYPHAGAGTRVQF
jgi:TPP-dependent pyruvate/acetoin dehydrogenase alpha subunit